MPLYQDYVSGCVHRDHLANNGTFIGRNLNSIVLNVASERGDAYAFAGVEKYNMDSTKLCGTEQSSSQKAWETVKQDWMTVTQAQATAVSDLNVLHSCVDVTAMNQLFNQSCQGYTPHGATIRQVQYKNLTSLIDLPDCLTTVYNELFVRSVRSIRPSDFCSLPSRASSTPLSAHCRRHRAESC